MRGIRKFLFAVVAASLLMSVGCGEQSGNVDEGRKLKVYTSFYTMYDFARKIGGDKIEIANMIPSGTEPHDWEPAPRDIAKLEKADVFIYNGAGMEGWVDKVLQSIDNKKLITVEASKGISLVENEDTGENGEEHDLQYDPHVWLNPALVKQQMKAIKNSFVEADQANSSYYEDNFTQVSKELDKLNDEFKNTISKYKRREIVVAHQAFGYMCNAYGLKQIAIEGLRADAEPTPAKMAEISRYAKENNVRVIFFEELINPKVAQTIADEVGAETEVLNPFEGLKEEDIKAGKEYFSVMRDNLKALEKALK